MGVRRTVLVRVPNYKVLPPPAPLVSSSSSTVFDDGAPNVTPLKRAMQHLFGLHFVAAALRGGILEGGGNLSPWFSRPYDCKGSILSSPHPLYVKGTGDSCASPFRHEPPQELLYARQKRPIPKPLQPFAR